MGHSTKQAGLSLLAGLLLCLASAQPSVQEKTILRLPDRSRTEGRLTLVYPRDGQRSQASLSFTESIDLKSGRNALSVGYVSYDPTRYFCETGQPTVMQRPEGACSMIDEATFVPELRWFTERMFPDYQVPRQACFVGPSGLVKLLLSLAFKAGKPSRLVHRNVLCDMHPFELDASSAKGGKSALRMELFVPTGEVYRNVPDMYFSVRASSFAKSLQQAQLSDFSDPEYQFTLDYFFVDSMEENEERFLREMRDDFNLPLGAGCSEFRSKVEPVLGSKSFSLHFIQASSSDQVRVAYDREHNLLRRALDGKSASIWDLEADLLYQIDAGITRNLDNSGASRPHEARALACAVLQVLDENLDAAFRPYEKVGESLSVLDMLGASTLAFMGHAKVRDIPCLVYETVLARAPVLFALPDSQARQLRVAGDFDYIVQFHLIEGRPAKVAGLARPDLTPDNFWPARIVLFRRWKQTNRIEQLDSLEVFEFYWSLDGWLQKSSSLFMPSACYQDEDEQLRLELDVRFDRIHGELATARDRLLLAHNKFKLESDLLTDVLQLFGLKRTHLVDYELLLRPTHVDMELVVADVRQMKTLVHYGEGILSGPTPAEQPRIELVGESEASCITTASLVADVSMAMFCPGPTGPDSDATGGASYCVIIYGGPTAASMGGHMKLVTDHDKTAPVCQLYQFKPVQVDRKAVPGVLANQRLLHKHLLTFEARKPEPAPAGQAAGQTELLEGEIVDWEVAHHVKPIMLAQYKFYLASRADGSLQDTALVRSFADFMDYRNEADCARMCDLDTTCRSYSFCLPVQFNPSSSSGSSGPVPSECLISRLDLEASRVRDQLAYSQASPSGAGRVTVNDLTANQTLEIQFASRCAIRARNYLSLYRQTDEYIRLEAAIVPQFRTTPSTQECAKTSIDFEEANPSKHVAMFAYCPATGTCLLDESLFSSDATRNLNEDQMNILPISDEVHCRLYRKKYQTYFGVSAKVLRVAPERGGQLELSLTSVEECARACWLRFGETCASFDFCSASASSPCLINQLASSEAQFETRHSCIHYERDLRLDRLRREHALGRHQLLDGSLWARDSSSPGGATSFGSLLWTLFSGLLVALAFVYGLVLGQHANEKMERVTILKQQAGASGPASQLFGSTLLSGGADGVAPYASFADDDEENTTDAIRMSVMKTYHNGIYEDADDEGDESDAARRDAHARGPGP